jgi:hypothetical protein
MLTDVMSGDRMTHRGETFAHRLERRGYHMLYRWDQVNHCPGCSHAHWYIGRQTAECGFCGTALPLADSAVQSGSGGHSRNRRPFVPFDCAA